MENDLISRQAAIDALMEILDRPNHAEYLYTDEICGVLGNLPSAQSERNMNNKVNLCDSCRKVFPECESTANDIFFGNGVGNDNVCACPHYEPKERKKGKWIHHTDWERDGECGYECSVCGMGSDVDYDFCMRCGADMRGEEDE